MTVLAPQPLTLSIPLYEDPPGVLRVGKSRVLLELVIHAFQRGETPEEIVQSYDTLSLPDVYAVVSYYLANLASIDEYLRQCDEKAGALRRKIEESQAPRENLRQLIMARAKAKGLGSDKAATFGVLTAVSNLIGLSPLVSYCRACSLRTPKVRP